jgi:hypothetical protein
VNLALKSATNVIKIRHTRNYQAKVDEAKRALGLISSYYSDLQGVINWLDKQEIDEKYAIGFVEKLIPSKEDDKASTRTQNIRNEIVTLFKTGRGNNGRTKYDLFNGITAFVTHSRSTRGGEDKDESRVESSLFGSGAILTQRAFNMLAA